MSSIREVRIFFHPVSPLMAKMCCQPPETEGWDGATACEQSVFHKANGPNKDSPTPAERFPKEKLAQNLVPEPWSQPIQ